MKNEYTINEAVKMCKKDGRMRRIDDPEGWIDKSDFSDREFYFTVEDAEILWIYESSQKSAFQEWDLKTPTTGARHHQVIQKEGRKEGWNACLEAVLKMVRHDDNFIADYDIETLREP
jgi:hypothetical protein